MTRCVAVLIIMSSFFFRGLFCQEVALEFVDSIPKEHQNVFFRTIPFIAIDNRGVIYATDNREHVVYRIDYFDEEMSTIGRPGQGPGDLYHPWHTVVEGNSLYVADDIGISIFSLNGVFRNRFRIFNKLISFAVKEDTIFVAEAGSEKLISGYAKNGERSTSFGFKYAPHPYIYKGWPSAFIDGIINDGKILIGKTNIYFISYCFAEIFKYDPDGIFISRQTLADVDTIDKNKKYYLEIGQTRSSNGAFKTNNIIKDACYFNEKLYLLMGAADERLREFEELVRLDERDLTIRSRLPLKNVRITPSSWGCRSIVCGLNKWIPNIFVSLYDEKADMYLINRYKEVAR